jgi:hypothetical protein
MRKLLLLIIVAAAGIWMFQHPETLRSKSTQVFAELSQYFASLAGNPAPVTLESAPAAELPNGVYCLTQAVRFTSAADSTLVPAGALVRKTGEGNGKVVVTSEMGSALVDATALTRDPVLVGRFTAEINSREKNFEGASQSASKRRLSEIDAQLASLKEELESIQRRDREARRLGRKITFATSEAFVRSTITKMERLRLELLASEPSRGRP